MKFEKVATTTCYCGAAVKHKITSVLISCDYRPLLSMNTLRHYEEKLKVLERLAEKRHL